MINYPFYNITEYLPVRYTATAEQEHDRQLCYNFKDGFLNDSTKEAFLNKIKELAQSKSNLAICFIPASTSSKTTVRYSKLAEAIKHSGFEADVHAIFNKYDKEAEHLTGKTNNTTESFGFNESMIKGKNIVLIDDIITRGVTFNQVAAKLMSLGALSVFGLFLAKTVNPDYHPGAAYFPEDYDEPDYDEPDYDEEDTYDRYNGSYAQDVEGWSDQDIDDVFDGDPDAYWNID